MKAVMLWLYQKMLEIRTCEESFVGPILSGEIKCPVHLYSGEEAIAAGVGAHLNPRDHIFGTHRSHGHYLAKGGDLAELVAEIYCKENGCSRGRGGSMHLVYPERGMLGSAPIVAGTISLALGAALASALRKKGQVTVSFFGDGATGEGVLYEALNFAALRKLPLIFVCENNLYSTHLPISECRVDKDIAEIAAPFGIPSLRVDGNDVMKVYEVAGIAVDQCRNGGGPYFLEFLTYRLRGHVGPNDNIQGSQTDIRPRGEIEEWTNRDPISRVEKELMHLGFLSKEQIESIRKEISHKVEHAHQRARKGSRPKPQHLKKYVYK